MENYSVFGLGNPLMDIIGHVSSNQIERLGAYPGTMSIVDENRVADIAAKLHQPEMIPGGSCANTLRGVAWLTSNATDSSISSPVMTGVIGDDFIGRDFVRQLGDLGIAMRFSTKDDTPTGISVVFVTPDGQRTMFTSLGASVDLSVEHLDFPTIAGGSCFYATAYLWGMPKSRDALVTAVKAGRLAGAKIAFDIADAEVVKSSGRAILDWVHGAVDVLFANEQEIRSLARLIPGDHADSQIEVVCEVLARLVPTLVVKLGAAGCLVWEEGSVAVRSQGIDVYTHDTTGAGDSFAAGYLYAMLNGADSRDSASLGNRVGAAIVQVDGCNYSAVSSKFAL